MKVYIGLDEREPDATRAAVASLRKVSNIKPELLYLPKLEAQGLVSRARDERGGQDYDIASNAHQSTRFAISRFLVPIICQEQWALFVDADVVFLEDPRHMLHEINDKCAVNVVKNNHIGDGTKMVNQVQSSYPRKNWTSVMLFNCLHPSNERLSLRDINSRPGRDLHQLYWLSDEEVGTLDARWNWLVNVQEKPGKVGVAHYTLGGPFTKGWKRAKHDDLWYTASKL